MYSHHAKNGTNQASIPKRYDGDCLLEVGNWKLIKARFPGATGVDSFPTHFCGKSPEGYGVHRGRTVNSPAHLIPEERLKAMEGTCIKCGERMPDEILGLWTLHNWDVATS